jgi:HSP20 family protein
LTDRIRDRAFEIFQGHNGGHGFATEDWLKAERDLLCACESEFVEQDGKFEVRMNAPGLEPGDVKVTALPDALIVKAASTHTHKGKDGEVRFCEFGQKSLYRRFDLPEPINLDKVTANLHKGVLHLTAIKAKSEDAPKQKAIAA